MFQFGFEVVAEKKEAITYWKSKEDMQQYLKDHPKAKPKNHAVKPPKKQTGLETKKTETKTVEKPVSKKVTVAEGLKKLNLNPNTIGHSVLTSVEESPKSLSELSDKLKEIGFKRSPASFLQKAVDENVLEKVDGKYQLLGSKGSEDTTKNDKSDEPVSTEAKDLPSGKDLKYGGDASGLGGAKKKWFLDDKSGNRYIFKPADDKFRAEVQAGVGDIMSMILPENEAIPVRVTESKGQKGSLQPFLPDIKADLSSKPIKSLTKSQLNDLQRERVVDWVISNHDSHGGNLLETNEGRILGADKEQAFRFINSDKLNTTYHPNKDLNEKPPVYNKMYDMWSNNQVDLDPNSVLPVIKKIESIPDSKWESALRPYVDQLHSSKLKRDDLMSKILKRKNSVRKDFEKFFSNLKKKRGEGSFKFND